MFDKRLIKNIDISIICIVVTLVIIGIVAISSATHVHATNDYGIIKKQIMWFIVGVVAAVFVMSIDYNTLGNVYIYIYGLSIILLVLVLIPGIGTKIKGARGWFVFKHFSIQPCEFVKIALIITFSKHVALINENDGFGINKFKNLILLLIHVAIPMILVMLEPEGGITTVYAVIVITILFVAGISYKYIIFALSSLVVAFPVLYFWIMEPHQQNRIKSFLNPELDPWGIGYQPIHSKIAIGSGQLHGKGLFHGTFTQLGFLPEQHTDFIFSVIGEELGFVWSVIVIILYIILLVKIVHLAMLAKDDLGRYITIGVFAMLFIHILINIGMTIGLAPIIGIPLPFLSYGGSSLLTNMIAIGLVLNVGMRRQKINF